MAVKRSCGGYRQVIGSDPSSYRDKLFVSGRLTTEHDRIARGILSEPSLSCEQLWWPVSGSGGGAAMVALGEKACLVMVVDSATIKRVGR